MKKLNRKIFIRGTIIFILLIFISELALYQYEIHQIHNLGWKISAEAVSLFRYPTLIFFWKYLITNNSYILFSIGTFLNCVIYAVIVERIFSFFSKKREIKHISETQ
jgi:hypothetical protein